jgi:hypothetical protein
MQRSKEHVVQHSGKPLQSPALCGCGGNFYVYRLSVIDVSVFAMCCGSPTANRPKHAAAEEHGGMQREVTEYL